MSVQFVPVTSKFDANHDAEYDHKEIVRVSLFAIYDNIKTEIYGVQWSSIDYQRLTKAYMERDALIDALRER